MSQRLALLNIVGLSPRHFERPDLVPHLSALAKKGIRRPLRPTFPAVTCSMQATLLSGKPPAEHGIIANGFFDRDAFEVKFWEQPAALVQAPRLWDLLPHRKTAVLFWQNSMFANAAIVVTPRPLHLDSGMVQWCYSKPAGYYEKLAAQISDFKLQHYWGPVAGLGSSRWIAAAAKQTWREEKSDLLLTYLPHLDYASQKFGPDSPQTHQALREIDAIAGDLLNTFGPDTPVIVCSEYALATVNGALYPNRLLRQAGLLRTRVIKDREYLDFELSDAFAMVDHQIAHIYCKPHAVERARQALSVHGIEFISIPHARSGELIAIAPKDKWFAYYWWEDWAQAPEFAYTVDIHRKPGYDPCELWFDWPKFLRTRKLPTTSTDPTLVKGSHGRVDNDPNDWAVTVFNEAAATELPGSEKKNWEAADLAPAILHLLKE